MSRKPLPDLDIDHPFYSEEAALEWKRKIKELVKEEIAMVEENRRRYKVRNKKEEKETNGK